jgi:hypothetical protein
MTLPPRSHIAVPLPGPDAELLTTICTICDGQPTRADFDRLERLLQDPAAMTVYLAVTEIDASLRWKLRGHTPWQAPADPRVRLPGHDMPRPPQATPPAPRVLPRKPAAPRRDKASHSVPAAPAYRPRPAAAGSILRRAALIGIVVLTAVTIGGGIAYVREKKSPPQIVTPLPRLPGSIACVTSLHDVTWSRDAGTDAAKTSPHPDLFASLFPGQRLALDRGLVEIAFDSGARVILEGPIACEIRSASAARLDLGRLTATVAKQAGVAAGPRFTVETPTATVTDIGTSFGVAVNEAGLTDVSVFDGLVDLLPRLEGDAGSRGALAALRLATGEAAALTAPGKISRRSPRGPIAFTRSMPKGSPSAPTGPSPLPWNHAQSIAIYRDAFKGSGQLTGSSPSRRSGKGDAAWTAPATQWDLTGDGLVAASRGKASLPFVPQPGRIYRVEATVTVTAGGNDWAAIGFSGAAAPDDPAMTAAWILQRHSTALDPNLMFFGSDAQNLRLITGDLLTGRRTFAILLDTTQPQWTVTFLADGRPLGGGVLPAHARIASVCLSCQGQAHVSCDDFSLLVMESFDESRN